MRVPVPDGRKILMVFELLPFLALAFALGFKHSYDADHLVAVSTILSRKREVRRAAKLSVTWALGHMATASVITVAIFLASEALLVPLLANFELLIAAMLIAIGAIALAWEFGLHRRLGAAIRRLVHEHPHEHGPVEHRHPHIHLGGHREQGVMLGIGVVHGLASNDELFVLLVAALGVATLPTLVVGIGLFTVGVMVGMIVFAFAITYPMERWGDEAVRRFVSVVAAVLSLAYGFILLAGV